MNYFVSPEFINALSTFGLVIGVFYIIMQYKAHPWFWYVSFFNAVPLMYVNAVQGNYASAILFFYYLAITIQVLVEKFLARHKAGKSEPTFIISRTPRRLYLPLATIIVVLTLVIYFAIDHFKAYIPEQFQPEYPLLDAGLTSLSFVMMWILKKNYFENWYGWIIVNAGYTVLYLMQGNYFFAANFAFWWVVAVMGVFNWRKLMAQQAVEQAQPTPQA